MKIIKKNQVVIFAAALMLITAGYLNFVGTDKENILAQTTESNSVIGDATLVSSEDVTESENIAIIEDIGEAAISDEQNKVDHEAKTNLEHINEESIDEYFTTTRLERDNMYSQIIESYQKMIESESVTAEQKAIAQNEITKINKIKNATMITENLIKTKGFEDAIILVNDESINVIIAGENLKNEEVAQIQNIVSREMNAEIENIHISNK